MLIIQQNTDMKHYILITIISILSITSIISNSIKLSSNSQPHSGKTVITEEEKIIYTLKDHNGRLALFESNNPKPMAVYEIFTSTLPETDQLDLKNGITVTSEKEAQKLIEEYTS